MMIHRRQAVPLAGLLLILPGLAHAEGPAGRHWAIAAIGASPTSSAHPADITFSAEGRAFGSTGCNRFTGGFTLNGAALRFGPVAGTRMACEPAAMDQEARLHQALDLVRGWRAEDSAVLLIGADGAPLLRLEPRG